MFAWGLAAALASWLCNLWTALIDLFYFESTRPSTTRKSDVDTMSRDDKKKLKPHEIKREERKHVDSKTLINASILFSVQKSLIQKSA